MRFQLAETQRSRISNKAAMTSLSVTIDLHIVSVGIIERQSTNYAALPAKAEPYDACTGLKNMKNQQMMWRSRGLKHIFNEFDIVLQNQDNENVKQANQFRCQTYSHAPWRTCASFHFFRVQLALLLLKTNIKSGSSMQKISHNFKMNLYKSFQNSRILANTSTRTCRSRAHIYSYLN